MWEYVAIAIVCFFAGYYVGFIVQGKWEANKHKFIKKTDKAGKDNKQR